jgi:hypothetical protein
MMADEERELESASFHPVLNTNIGVESFLRIKSDPRSYIQRVQDREQEKEERRMRLKDEEERKKYEECTFSPQVRDAPAFVKRIARSVRMTKQPSAFNHTIGLELGTSWK